ncbi:NADH-quinone oxidoreductase subunit A [Desulfovibrio sp. Huiquan2017]|uniref:NADH-quinone oxidoreductase subunit A n=1 Tax=Desulfovibrio sp. Huiquan2017 TaxID=2816861 RepID=UPI001A91495F|nr:NADH-quinone oxidoreductase subunit A [Desulfovibrio sp. Huiquan2017]
MLFDWLHFAIVLFLLGGVLFAVGPLLLAVLLAPQARGGDIGMPYECGMVPYGSSWSRWGVSYYVYALIFLAFDVDVLYLFPVSTAYADAEGWVPFVKVFIFLFFLIFSVIYFWAKGVFTWPRRIQ